MLQEGVTIAAVGERHVQDLGVLQGLLHSVANFVVVVLGFDDGERKVGFEEKQVIRLLGLPALDRLASDDDATHGEISFFPDLSHQIPTRSLRPAQRRSDKLGSNVRFGEGFFVHLIGFSESQNIFDTISTIVVPRVRRAVAL